MFSFEVAMASQSMQPQSMHFCIWMETTTKEKSAFIHTEFGNTFSEDINRALAAIITGGWCFFKKKKGILSTLCSVA